MSNSFDINEYKIKRTLSADTQASVLYEHVKTKKQIVIKELLHKPFERNPETQFPVEIEKIKPLCHMALAHFITSIPPRSGHTYRIVTEFYPNGSLETLVNKLAKNNPPDDYSPTKMSIIIYGIATALKYLHEKGVIHGNLRPTNVLLDEHMQPRLVDYGFKRDFANSQYCSPELFQKQDYDFSTDIYSFGMLLCYIYVQESPFDESLTFENLVDFVPDGERPILPGNVPQKIADLIEKMWSQNPADRPSISYIHRLLGDDDYLFPGTNVEEFQEYVKRANSTGPEPIMKPVGDGNPNNMYRFGIMLKKKASLDKKKMIDAARYFKAAADKGVSEAAFEYAQLALKGIGIPQDTEDAAKYFKMAADSGNPEAMYEFAEMVTLGLGTPKDDALAAQYYKKAGDNGNAEAMHKYMKFEASKNTGQTKKDDLMKGFKAAADSGVGQSAYEYGLLAKKEGKTSDSIKYFKQAADNGIAPAAFELAKIFQQDRNKVAVTAKYFQIAADGGIMEAAYQFGLIMQTCKTPLRKMEETAKYFKIAADSGIAGALYQMFLMVHNGIGMSRSEPDANRYLEMASEKNFFPALYRSALVMQAYDNIPEYRKLSGDNFKKAADSNNLDAVYHFAIMKKTGACCVKKNIKQSAHYFKVAAGFGNPYAMYQYALMLLTGNGVTADESQTIQYYKKAADAGFPDAMYQYALIMKATPKQNATKQTMAEATKYFKMALDAGVTDQQYQQALTFQTGKNAHLKQKEAAECFKKAAESSGNPNAYYQYALIVQAMDYEPGNAKIAADSFQKAADGGHVDAAYRYALMIKTGAAGAKKNLMESARYFKIAADGGNANAAYQYALMKHMGNGILREDDEAAKYFKIASDSTSNNVDAMYQYAFMQPISNEKEAAEYFQMANTTY